MIDTHMFNLFTYTTTTNYRKFIIVGWKVNVYQSPVCFGKRAFQERVLHRFLWIRLTEDTNVKFYLHVSPFEDDFFVLNLFLTRSQGARKKTLVIGLTKLSISIKLNVSFMNLSVSHETGVRSCCWHGEDWRKLLLAIQVFFCCCTREFPPRK
jgi:hypothetical protein